MSTLFLVGNPQITGTNTARNKNPDFDEVLSTLETPTFNSLIDRVLVMENLQDLFIRIYKDRLLPLPNRWNYESTTSLIVYNSSYPGSQIDIDKLSRILSDYFTVLNIIPFDVNSATGKGQGITASITELLNIVKLESKIHRDRVLEINHWMNHSKENCFSRIYTMLDHIMQGQTNLDLNEKGSKIPDSVPSKSGHYSCVPQVISDIRFGDIILGDDGAKDGTLKPVCSESFYLDLFSDWAFTGLLLPPRELIQCLFCVIRHLSRLANLKTSENRIYLFLMTMELSYHQVNRFHNFKHATDVAQATWVISQRIGISDYRVVLLLVITAIGHDIGHPGTNNNLFNESYTGFTTSNMTSSGASLCSKPGLESQPGERKEQINKLSALFDKCSVLENFHFLSLKKILSIQWREILDMSRSLEQSSASIDLIKTGIIFTDMQLHFKYLEMMNSKKNGDELSLAELVCVIIKAADISNVAKPLEVSSKWAYLISLEFKDCAALKDFYQINRKKLADNETCASFIDTEGKSDYKEPEEPEEPEDSKNDDIHNDDMEFEIQMVHNFNRSDFSVDALVNKEKSIPAGQVLFIDTFAMAFFKQLAVLFPRLEFLVRNLISNRNYWVVKRDELARNAKS